MEICRRSEGDVWWSSISIFRCEFHVCQKLFYRHQSLLRIVHKKIEIQLVNNMNFKRRAHAKFCSRLQNTLHISSLKSHLGQEILCNQAFIGIDVQLVMFAISPDILFSAALHLLSAQGVFCSAYFMIYMLKFLYCFLAYTVYANTFAFESWRAPSRVLFTGI